MLTFFRRIRKGFLGDGATAKYLIYAIGEIALVVIGILIALQINNWNEWRKDRVMEVSVLKNLENTIERNNELMDNILTLLELNDQSKQIILNAIEYELPYSDTMKIHFHLARRKGVATFNLNMDGYESFKNIGFHILSNESLKDDIVFLFEVAYPDAENIASWVNEVGLNTRDNINKYFYYTEARNELIPINYDQLLDDERYISLLHEVGQTRGFLRPHIIECQRRANAVLNRIQEELKNRTESK